MKNKICKKWGASKNLLGLKYQTRAEGYKIKKKMLREWNLFCISGAGHGHSHDGGHGHSHGGHGHSHGGSNEQIFKGVYLHILADTLGSVGVIVSALLMQYFGWMIADPICSMIIAILIFISVGSLLKESTAILMQRQPKELDNKLPECYNKVWPFFKRNYL